MIFLPVILRLWWLDSSRTAILGTETAQRRCCCPRLRFTSNAVLDRNGALLAIESGATSTYGRVAAGCGYPRAVRAVGSAVGSNPISIIVPCHRVLPAGGGVGNYGGGPDKKEFLLKLEHAINCN